MATASRFLVTSSNLTYEITSSSSFGRVDLANFSAASIWPTFRFGQLMGFHFTKLTTMDSFSATITALISTQSNPINMFSSTVNAERSTGEDEDVQETFPRSAYGNGFFVDQELGICLSLIQGIYLVMVEVQRVKTQKDFRIAFMLSTSSSRSTWRTMTKKCSRRPNIRVFSFVTVTALATPQCLCITCTLVTLARSILLYQYQSARTLR